jgi:hypothetical protein
MRIEQIIYDSTREILNVEDKLRIATLFLFCDKLGSKKLSELLYSNNHILFIEDLNNEYSNYEIDFNINFNNTNVYRSFYKTLDKVKSKWDSNGFLKALYERDPYALVICDIVNYNFEKHDINKMAKKITQQLSLF